MFWFSLKLHVSYVDGTVILPSCVDVRSLLTGHRMWVPGPSPNNNSIGFEIWSKFAVLYFKIFTTDHSEILHIARQLHFHDVCKISLWSVEYIFNQSASNFGLISNSITSLVGQAPASAFLLEASFGLRVLSLPASVCVCLSVCLSGVNHLLVRVITLDPFKLGSPNLDQRCKRPWLRSLLFCGLFDLDLQGQI